MRNIIIDCDPGHDDVIAIFLAAAHPDKLKILGLTIVGGNTTLDNLTRNALVVKDMLKADFPVVKGADTPLVRELQTASDFHGESGLEGPILPEPISKSLDIFAPIWMYETIMKQDDKVTIVATAPLTNVALLLKGYPDVRDRIEQIVLMGGGLEQGNFTPLAEFNILCDPEAADLVFQSGLPIVMAGLDVTLKANFDFNFEKELENKGVISKFTADLLKHCTPKHKMYKHEGNPMHDVCTIAYLLDESIFDGQMHNIRVETKGELTTGFTFADRRFNAPINNKNTKVLLNVDEPRYRKLVEDALDKLDRELE